MAEQALHYKQLHEWGYRFNDSGKIQDLTTHQQRMIQLAESAEAYVKQEQRNRSQHSANSSINTKSGLENRDSKRKRIQQAKRGNLKN